MKKKNWVLSGLIVFLVVAGSFTVGFSSRASIKKQKDDATCCCEKMNNCKGNAGSSGKMMMDDLSHQFLSISLFGY